MYDSHSAHLRLPFVAAAALTLAAACTEDDPVVEQTYPVTIPFAAVVGDAPFECGTGYTLGTSDSTFVGADLRMFVFDLVVFDGEGTHHPVTLDATSEWQTESVALLDFEDGTQTCINGTAGRHTELTGTTTTAEVTGLSFWVGVPEDLNHGNQALAPSPLDVTSMFWSWTAGYKFIRIDGSTTGLGDSFRYHLGSTACERESNVEIDCARPNRPFVELDGFDPAVDAVAFDLAALFADSDLDSNAEDSAPGCMSELDDPDCDDPAAALGLDPVTGQVVGAQRAFRVLSGD